MADHIQPLLNNTAKTRRPFILDGALATELERHASSTLNTPLWSAHILLTDPSLIQRVHTEYYLAGADVAITASYQAATKGLELHAGLGSDEAARVVGESVRVASAARDDALKQLASSGHSDPEIHRDGEGDDQGKANRVLLVAGSVGPYGAYLSDGSEYTGTYPEFASLGTAAFKQEMKAFHRARVAALVDAGADLLALETQPCFGEIEALCELLRDEFPGALAWVSCTVREGEGEGGVVLSDGTSLERVCSVLEHVGQIIAVGVNCCPKELVSPALKEMKRWTRKPLVAYPNSGEEWDAINKVWGGREKNEKSWEAYVKEWMAEGATLIGGCCRTTPDDVRCIRESCDGLD